MSDPIRMSYTKIVCTIGPATEGRSQMADLARAGMNVVRLNFSHGTHDWHRERIRLVRDIEQEIQRPIAILQDLCGPKMRIGGVPAEGIELLVGRECKLTTVPSAESNLIPIIPVPIPGLVTAFRPGNLVYLDDAQIELEVVDRKDGEVRCCVRHGGVLFSRKGIAAPGVSFQIDALTKKDLSDAAFGIAEGVDYIGVSFVRQASDLFPVRQLIDNAGSATKIIAKIEKPEAIENLSSILAAVDGLMVARGDLGVEVPLHQVPILQKRIIHQASTAGKPVITATQMLESMIKCPRPTRAEVSDVANAVFDGTSAVMLSGETAMGAFPIQAVRIMSATARFAEENLPYERMLRESIAVKAQSRTEAITHGIAEIADEVAASAILCSTTSGSTARELSRLRLAIPIIAATHNIAIFRQLSLLWGVRPLLVTETTNSEERIAAIIRESKAMGWITSGQTVAIATVPMVGVAGGTNGFRVETV